MRPTFSSTISIPKKATLLFAITLGGIRRQNLVTISFDKNMSNVVVVLTRSVRPTGLGWSTAENPMTGWRAGGIQSLSNWFQRDLITAA